MDTRSQDDGGCPLNRRGALGLVILLVAMLMSACGSFHPRPMSEVPFLARTVSQEKGKGRVTVAVPTGAESTQLFGVPLATKGIQPVWLRIENHDTVRISRINGIFAPPPGRMPLMLAGDHCLRLPLHAPPSAPRQPA